MVKRIINTLEELISFAQKGEPEAQYDLGLNYALGKRGLPQNYAEALKWYRKAADQGLAEAYNNLGRLYEKGRGVPQNYAEALKWYRKAADQGLAVAQFNLGTMYHGGKGVPEDYIQAHMWYNLAAAQSYVKAADARDMIAQMMTTAQIAEAQELSKKWKIKNY